MLDPVSGKAVVCKRMPRGVDAAALWAELRNESLILQRLLGVPGCLQWVRLDEDPHQLVVEDFGGVALDRSGLLGQVDLPTFLTLAERLADALAQIHAKGITHKDIHPGNLLVRPQQLQVQVIDFGLASTFADEHPEFEHHNNILGTLAYISPEQTGRMNRSVDYRTDLYALGCTLYHLATGSPPFTDTDPLSLIHAHLARTPAPPQERAPWLPLPVANLITDLLAKEPDQRYQSASGVAADLQLFAQTLARGEPLDGVQPKQRDRLIAPHAPRRLYGRNAEIATLHSCFTKAMGNGSQALMVKGFSGVGKTSLVYEIHSLVTAHHGVFISGKFDQFLSDPFSAPAQSLRQLCQSLLSEPDTVIDALRQHLAEALGTDAGALFDVVPDLEALLGAQCPVSALGPIESLVRLRGLLVALVGAIATPVRPMVLFLDDLQWADQPSLDFLSALLQEGNLRGLLLVGAYRDNEVDSTHPLAALLRSLNASGVAVTELALGSLASADTTDMLADMLRMPAQAIEPLAGMVFRKTGGNPFYTVEFLNTLHRDGVLSLNPQSGEWQWDMRLLAATNATDSVVDFLAKRMSKLPDDARQVLLTAACLGNEFGLGVLAVATGLTPSSVTALLGPALERGILVTPSAVRFQQADESLNLRFCHDRMQQVAYALHPSEDRAAFHLRIARRFAAHADASGLSQRAAQNYMQAVALLDDPAERAVARSLMAAAAVQARQAGAFAGAEKLLHCAIALLPADPWSAPVPDAFALHTELHLVQFSLAKYDALDASYQTLQARAPDPVALVEPSCIQVVGLSNRTRYADAVALSSQLLERLGLGLPSGDDLLPALQSELGQFYAYVQSGALERLPESTTLHSPQWVSIGKLLSRTVPAAFFGQPLVSLWCILRGARVWANEGYFFEANYLMGCVILPTVAFNGDYASGYRAGRLSLDASQLRGPEAESARTRHVFALFNCHWFEPLEAGIDHAHEAHRALRRSGDLENACFAFYTSLAGFLDCRDTLQDLQAELDAADAFCDKTGNRHAQQAFLAFGRLVQALEGKTSAPGSFGDAAFCEQTHAQAVQDNPMAQAYYRAYRALSACIYDDGAALVTHSQAALELVPFITGFYPVALIHFLHALALVQQLPTASEPEHASLLEQLQTEQEWLARRSADAPMNFSHLNDLVEAEHLDATDQPWLAQQCFERAMAGAQTHRRAWHHALITERFALFQLRRASQGTGRLLLARALDLYQAWGASGKVRQLQQRWPFLPAHAHGRASLPGSHASTHTALDNQAILQASQSLSSETSLPRLVETLLATVSKLTGATGSAFLLCDDVGQWFLEGGYQGAQNLPRQKASDCEGQAFSSTVMRLGLKLGKPVVSDDAVQDKRFASDPYFSGKPLCSVLGLPVQVRGRRTGFLLLENSLMQAAFGAERVQSVSMLAGQLAISIENARLYESLESKVAERTRELGVINAKLAALSSTDGLTGIANRRRFDDVLAQEWSRAGRNHQPLSVAMLDVDWFKKYNDHYGHQAGDECLRQVAQAFASTVRRSTDLVARYGGEEFVLIAPNTDKEAALHLATSICRAIAYLALPHALSPYHSITASMGVATVVPDAHSSPSQLLKQADDALYQAKAQGRNRAVG